MLILIAALVILGSLIAIIVVFFKEQKRLVAREQEIKGKINKTEEVLKADIGILEQVINIINTKAGKEAIPKSKYLSEDLLKDLYGIRTLIGKINELDKELIIQFETYPELQRKPEITENLKKHKYLKQKVVKEIERYNQEVDEYNKEISGVFYQYMDNVKEVNKI